MRDARRPEARLAPGAGKRCSVDGHGACKRCSVDGHGACKMTQTRRQQTRTRGAIDIDATDIGARDKDEERWSAARRGWRNQGCVVVAALPRPSTQAREAYLDDARALER